MQIDNELTLRPFHVADIEAARSLWRQSVGVGLSAADEPAALQGYLQRNPDTSFVVSAAAGLVGTILCGHDGRRGMIHHLVVAQGYQRRGLATALLHQGLDALGQKGISKCHLLVFANNPAGQLFWSAVGAQRRTGLQLYSIDVAPLDAGR